jgi:hypothetical protein
VSESVTVESGAPLLETANPSIGQSITSREVDDFPVNGRTPMMLDNLAMGVISTFEPGPVRPFDNGAPNSITIGGAPSSRNEVQMDGMPNAGATNQMAYSPPQDAVSEVRVNAFDMDASNGHTMGGTVNVITKSGTNSVHGTAYIFNQTSRFDANTFFNNAHNVPRPSYHQNQYGVNGGGPVYVPKVFNGKNRVFWFFAYEGMKDSDPANSPLETGNPENFTSVPTLAERQGDFSALLKLGPQYQIYDPTQAVLQGTQVSRQPFPNNIIPQDRLNSVALNYLKYFPLPNTPGNADGSQNYVINAIDFDNYDNELGRADFNISDANKLSFEARHNSRLQNKNNFFGNPATGNYLYRINQGAGLEDVFTLNPTSVLDIRASWTRYIENHASPADNIDPTSLGFPSYISANAQALMLPYIAFASNGTGVSGGARAGFEPLGYNGDQNNFNDSFQIAGQLQKLRGNHTMKMGVDTRRYQWSAFTFGNASGSYSFKSDWTNNPAQSTTAAPIGQDFAAFLLGLPSSGSIDVNTHSTVRADYLAFYFNDDWRVKPSLTLNFGLRWDKDFPETEMYNRTVNGFDPSAVTPVSAAAAANYAANPNSLLPASQFHPYGGLAFANTNAPHIYTTRSKMFSPRVGFAWTPPSLHNKTTIRGGFGIFVDPILLPTPYQYGFSQTTQMAVTADNYLTPITTFSNPFPGGSILQPTGSAFGAGTFLGQAINFLNPNTLNPYSMRWELSVQHELPGQMVLEVAYIASHSVHELVNRSLNFVPRPYLSASPVRNDALVSQLTGATPNPFQGLLPNGGTLNGKTVALQQLLMSYPQFTTVTEMNSNDGSSTFESLNVRLQKRLTNGLTLLNNFIWSKTLDRLVFLNASDPTPTRQVSNDSRPLREVFAATYNLPVGRGRALPLRSRWADAVVGGWQLSGILTLQSGPPLSWGSYNYTYYGGSLNLQPAQPNGTAFDVTRFNTVSTQQPQFSIRTFDYYYNNLRRDMTNELDVSLDKNFTFLENKYLQLRFEAYNVFNHVTFGAPNLNPTSSTFGVIGSQANTPRRIETGLRLVW